MPTRGSTAADAVLVLTERGAWLTPDGYPEVHRRFRVVHRRAADVVDGEEAALLVVDGALLSNGGGHLRRLVGAAAPPLPVIVTSPEPERWLREERTDLAVFDALPEPPSEPELLRTLEHARRFVESERRLRESREAAERKARELEELHKIGIALSAERDHDRLLGLILGKSREITGADAGSLFVVESIDMPIGKEDKAGNQARVTSRWLRFRMAQNDSVDFRFEEQVLPISPESIAGYVAETGRILNIEDAYRLDATQPFAINRSFDEATGYRSRSMLVVPMINHVGETIGVLQLINKKRRPDARLTSEESFEREVVPFTELDEMLVRSLASQAAVSVDNNRLYRRIEKLFADFVEASVRTIESRDKVTQGHSRRVARMSEALAVVADRVDRGPYRDLRLTAEEIRELKYAALLHDFGKVGVREKVLVKATKLYHGQMALIRERFRGIQRAIEAEHYRRLVDRLCRTREPLSPDDLAALDEELRRRLAAIDAALETVERANEPTVTHSAEFGELDALAERRWVDIDGREKPFLEADELDALRLAKGTLTREEREQIQSHVDHTYEFLCQIPWPRDLQNIPRLARSHHEKLDGSGYPHGLRGDDIPPQTRMITIADIYDALAAQDRPYKPAVPTDRALDILRDEARRGQLDEALLELFIDAKVYELAHGS